MKGVYKHLSILSSPGFLAGLVLLLANDWFLKDYLYNWFSGKLSDFAGMFIFPLFWVALFPRLGKHAFWASALWFIYWKSPYSQWMLDSWNELGLYSIHRVVDLTDLLALVMVPLAYRYWNSKPDTIPFKLHPLFPLGIAAFAFMATSQVHSKFSPNDSFVLPYGKNILYKRLDQLGTVYVEKASIQWEQNPDTISFNFSAPESYKSAESYGGEAVIAELSNGQVLFILSTIHYMGQSDEKIEAQSLSLFYSTVRDSLLY